MGPNTFAQVKTKYFKKIQEKVRNNLAHLQNIQDEWNKLENQTKEIDENQKTTLENNRAIAKNMLFQIEQILMESCVGRNSELLLSFIAREKENLEQQKKHNEEINKRIQDMPFLEMFDLDEKLEEAKAKPPSDTFVAIQLDNSRVLHSQALGNKIAQELKGALNAALNETPKNEKDLSTQAQSNEDVEKFIKLEKLLEDERQKYKKLNEGLESFYKLHSEAELYCSRREVDKALEIYTQILQENNFPEFYLGIIHCKMAWCYGVKNSIEAAEKSLELAQALFLDQKKNDEKTAFFLMCLLSSLQRMTI
eukprot:TRINITY_DN3122_c0_g1_i1.p1 TRINITY_DN3122_c0_g1~~TRINITY_DN3122_c0_g1_i1.p1  ORF type:complete len:309 (-),score=70.56 TRINITY_DN3122_c0_g1_i1:246-1172(-)